MPKNFGQVYSYNSEPVGYISLEKGSTTPFNLVYSAGKLVKGKLLWFKD